MSSQVQTSSFVVVDRPLGSIAELEGVSVAPRPESLRRRTGKNQSVARRDHAGHSDRLERLARIAASRQRRWWLAGLAIALGWALWDVGVGRGAQINPGGWPLVAKFLRGAVHPAMPPGFWHAVLVTLAYAVVGTALSVVLGAVGGILVAESTWRRRIAVDAHERRIGWWGIRALLAIPRGIHEAVWGLLLLNVLGLDPLVGILAIAIPYSAITAKVYAELIDESAAGPYRALRASGASRTRALLYGVLPITANDLASYGFYRLECSIRASVILGLIGAGGLGFLLRQSFDALNYGQLWFLVYTLMVLSALGEGWSATLRRRRTPLALRFSIGAALVATAAATWWLKVKPWTLWSGRTQRLGAQIGRQAWPPHLPDGGWPTIAATFRETFAMSLVAIAIAAAGASGLAVLGARTTLGTGGWTRGVSAIARLAALLTRAIPASVWALLVLFVVLPGPLPGAIALGVYTTGVLTRLFGEVLENTDQRPRQAARSSGATALQSFAYGSLPLAAPRWQTFALYRWEVAARETVIVGLVGAGGLGRLLSRQVTAFDYRGMVVTLSALIFLTFVVDLLSAATRRVLR